MRRLSALLFVSIFLPATVFLGTGCTHSVMIDSDPSGAEIKVNGEKIGAGPVTYNESTGWEKIYDIEATKPGYKTTRRQVKQSEWNIPVTAGAVAPAVLTGFVCFPSLAGLLFARQLPDRVIVPMDRSGGAPVGEPSGAPPSSYGY